MSLATPSRVLAWDGCYNVRDLGGLPTRDGRTTGWGCLVRSDIPSRLSETGRQSLVDHGVRTVVDLRYARELEDDWDTYPFRDGARGIRVVHVPFDTGRDHTSLAELRAAYHAARSREELNRLDLDLNGRGIAAAVAAIADAPPGGVLVHCHAGKDRTGIVVALALSAIGVDDDTIADDYAMTAVNLEPLIVEWLDSQSADPLERDRLRKLAHPAREAMLETLHYVEQRCGSAEQFLLRSGVTPGQLARLRARLLEPVDG